LPVEEKIKNRKNQEVGERGAAVSTKKKTGKKTRRRNDRRRPQLNAPKPRDLFNGKTADGALAEGKGQGAQIDKGASMNIQ